MERATGSRSLVEMAKKEHDDEASSILCQTIAKLHSHQPPYPFGLMPLNTWFRGLEAATSKLGGVFVESDTIAKKLLKDQREIVALHGDIHHGNVLDFGERSWLAIDPKGLVGERGFDYANIFCNPDAVVATEPGRLMKQVKLVSETAALDPHRLLQWIAAWAGLSAAWSFADKMDFEPAMTVAKMAMASLQRLPGN
jgi:streptomycin 6-kinase